jgi:hypothetical protein
MVGYAFAHSPDRELDDYGYAEMHTIGAELMTWVYKNAHPRSAQGWVCIFVHPRLSHC